MTETGEARLKRMRMRSWRRGTKEMDLVLGPWADEHLAGLSGEELAVYDHLLSQDDHDLMSWLLRRDLPPESLAALLERIAAFAGQRDRKTI
ncbi:MAG: succinate dehydrogenase assembly factor 2 [Tabrizicola sp.]|nr:succinate dehydrogenase assembly factor 2 [Tabrizicola sp.]